MEQTEAAALDAAYSERNRCVVALVKMALALGMKAGVRTGSDDPDWPVVLVDLPTGQVSWHLPQAELNARWPDMPRYAGTWDGHTTEEKYARLDQLPATLGYNLGWTPALDPGVNASAAVPMMEPGTTYLVPARTAGSTHTCRSCGNTGRDMTGGPCHCGLGIPLKYPPLNIR